MPARRAFAMVGGAGRAAGADADRMAAVRAHYDAASRLVGTPGAEYLAGRGIAPELADAAGVRYTADFYGRPAALFPLRDRLGLLVAVNGRYVDGRSDPKARTAGRKALGVFATPGALDAERVAVTVLTVLVVDILGLVALQMQDSGANGAKELPPDERRASGVPTTGRL